MKEKPTMVSRWIATVFDINRAINMKKTKIVGLVVACAVPLDTLRYIAVVNLIGINFAMGLFV